MADLNQYHSHPNKKLLEHTLGVTKRVKNRTNLKIAEFSAIFHDIGKLNPNFQSKLNGKQVIGYSNHSYISTYSFLKYCFANYDKIKRELDNEDYWLTSIMVIISHHHTDLPNLDEPISFDEAEKAFDLLQDYPNLPLSEFLFQIKNHKRFLTIDENNKNVLSDFPLKMSKVLQNRIRSNLKYLSFFLETQFSFASLIAADKDDASQYEKKSDLTKFCRFYNDRLENYIAKFEDDSELNILRTNIREEAEQNLLLRLNERKLFSLASPTGSGKTITLLSLAGKILEKKGDYRIIYSLPFLSITEQVENVCKDIFKDNSEYVVRIDSKSENKTFQELQNKLESDPDILQKLFSNQFAQDTFDYPLIITTFVRVFETLLSNKNSTLLKLSNFSKTIFLIDEIQALPPRLYSFFIAFLDEFCRKFDSFAIISSATMPNFSLPENNPHNLSEFFENFQEPMELVSLNYFNKKVFNRYSIENKLGKITIGELAETILIENDSALVILNTIDDSKRLFEIINQEKNSNIKLLLLNTHFIPTHRKTKINAVKWFLEKGIKTILISTQLIEAGVDIDFPLVFRDIAPIPSIIQAAGRCNRNGRYKSEGRFVLFELIKENNSRAQLIYKGRDKELLRESIKVLNEKLEFSENKLMYIQKNYFDFIKDNLYFGLFTRNKEEIDLVQKIKEFKFEVIGSFQLIDKNIFGEEIKYYIPKNKFDNDFEILEEIYYNSKNIDSKDWTNRKLNKIQIDQLIKKMFERIVQVRIKWDQTAPISDKDPIFNIYKISNSYTSQMGIELSNVNQFI